MGDRGALDLARDLRPPRRDHARLERRRWTSTRTLAHRLGVNQFFTDLAGDARTHPGARLRQWLPEAACQRAGAFTGPDPGLLRAYQPRIRPDGYGLWEQGDRVVPFFLEYDTGGEQLSILTGKLPGYRDLFATLGRAWPVLFWLHSSTRANATFGTASPCCPPSYPSLPVRATTPPHAS